MKKKYLIIIIFIITALLQIIIPLKTVIVKENIFRNGKKFKFRTGLVDPWDIFRGRFIILNFEDRLTQIDNYKNLTFGDQQKGPIYVKLATDSLGLAIIKDYSKTIPTDGGENYIKIQAFINKRYPQTITLRYPVNRFYMEEFKAPLADKIYVKSLRDTNKLIYATVLVKSGEMVLDNIFIDNIPLQDFVNKNNIIYRKSKKNRYKGSK